MSFMPFINEFHYDNTGTDVGEFIEIAGLAGTDLSQYSIVRYNGTSAPTAAILSSAGGSLSPLSGVITDMQNGYGVISFALPANGLENGSSDGFALVGPGNVVLEFLSYEGVISTAVGAAAGLTSTDVGVLENGTNPIGTSIARTGTGTQGSDFTWVLDTDDTPGAINNSQSFVGGGGASFSINDVSQAEGNSGTISLTFTVSRSDGAGAATVDFATADATATVANADYISTSGTLNFADGELSKTISVTVNGDTANEANETFTVNLSNATGGLSIGDGQGVGTITNDDSTITRIHDIQGAQHSSPLVGQTVTIQGIVTAVDSNGFYIQC
ncbi:Calx-beta domain-containing protein [Sphingobium fluviale]|nr:Calx-beta domain-containing protein [Sphingobium fluviale]